MEYQSEEVQSAQESRNTNSTAYDNLIEQNKIPGLDIPSNCESSVVKFKYTTVDNDTMEHMLSQCQSIFPSVEQTSGLLSDVPILNEQQTTDTSLPAFSNFASVNFNTPQTSVDKSHHFSSEPGPGANDQRVDTSNNYCKETAVY